MPQTPLRHGVGDKGGGSVQSRRLKATTAYRKWADKPWNRARMMIVSWTFGKKGWQLFNDAYFLAQLENKIANMKGHEPQTWWQAMMYQTLPDNVQIITQKDYENSNQVSPPA